MESQLSESFGAPESACMKIGFWDYLIFLVVCAVLWIYIQGENKHTHMSTLIRRPCEEHDVIRLVLLGKTGAGKSATGNTIIGSNVFATQETWSSETKVCHRHTVKINDTEVHVIDTPGLFDTGRTAAEVEQEITKCILLSSPGPHAFIMTIRADIRFTEEEYAAYTMLKEMFGKEVVNHMIIAFTRTDQRTTITIDKMLATAPTDLKEILSDVQNRYVTINNVTPDNETTNAHVLKLIEMTKDIKSTLKHFADDRVKNVETLLEQKVCELMKEKQIEHSVAKEQFLEDIEEGKMSSFVQEVGIILRITHLVASIVVKVLLSPGVHSTYWKKKGMCIVM